MGSMFKPCTGTVGTSPAPYPLFLTHTHTHTYQVGWFARDIGTLCLVGDVLLPRPTAAARACPAVTRLIVATDYMSRHEHGGEVEALFLGGK